MRGGKGEFLFLDRRGMGEWRMGFGSSWLVAACTAVVWRSAREVLSVEGFTRCRSVGPPESRWDTDVRKRD